MHTVSTENNGLDPKFGDYGCTTKWDHGLSKHGYTQYGYNERNGTFEE